MTNNRDHDYDRDHDRDRDRDHEPNPDSAVTPAPTGSALTALTALGTVLNNVDTVSIAGRSSMPLLQFKARENNGTWMFGQRHTVPETGSRWAVNPTTFQRGYICWGDGNKVLGERLLPVSLPMPNLAELPDLGFPWLEWAVNLKCLSGADAGTEVVHKMSTVGGIQAIVGQLEAVRDRINGGQHEGKVSAIVLLEKGSYQHGQYGKTWTPSPTVVDWMPLSGPTAPPPPPPPPAASSAEQPRRRRV